MSLRKFGGAPLALVLALAAPMTNALAQSKGKVLVVMASAQELDLYVLKKYATGYYLD